MTKSRASFSRLPRPVNTNSSSSNQFASPGNTFPRSSVVAGAMRGPVLSGPIKRSGSCFRCGKVGHWRSECPLLAVAQTHEGKKLSNLNMNLFNAEFFSQSNDTCSVVSFQEGEPGEEVDNLCIDKGDFLESESAPIDQVRGRLKTHLHAWEELSPT